MGHHLSRSVPIFAEKQILNFNETDLTKIQGLVLKHTKKIQFNQAHRFCQNNYWLLRAGLFEKALASQSGHIKAKNSDTAVSFLTSKITLHPDTMSNVRELE